MTSAKPATPDSIQEAATLLRVVLLDASPTETVYGLGADATNDAAVAAIFDTKKRPAFNPLIVHFANCEMLAPHVIMTDLATSLADAFWPGPLTLVLKRAPDTPISKLVSAGLETMAVRVPKHPIAQSLIRACNTPIAAPSANRFGDISPTRAEHVAASLGDGKALILDGGQTDIGIESTVIDLSENTPTLLRPGFVTQEMIEQVIGPLMIPKDNSEDGAHKSPGRELRHYAPKHPLRINVTELQPGDVLLAFGESIPDHGDMVLNLSPKGDLREAAANLFAMLHTLDRAAPKAIAVMAIPETGLGVAINDRLRRAAHSD